MSCQNGVAGLRLFVTGRPEQEFSWGNNQPRLDLCAETQTFETSDGKIGQKWKDVPTI